MADTERAFITNEAKMAEYRRCGYDSVWVSGAGCCKACTELNGITLKGSFRPPLHGGCTCTVRPEEKLGEGILKILEKSKQSDIITNKDNEIPCDSNGEPFELPRAENVSKREAGKVTHEINNIYNAKYENKPKGLIITFNPDDDKAYNYWFEIHGFDEYNIYEKKLNRK